MFKVWSVLCTDRRYLSSHGSSDLLSHFEIIFLLILIPKDVGYQHGKLLFTGWARGDIIDNMLKDHRSADYNDSKINDVRRPHATNSIIHKLYCLFINIKGSEKLKRTKNVLIHENFKAVFQNIYSQSSLAGSVPIRKLCGIVIVS